MAFKHAAKIQEAIDARERQAAPAPKGVSIAQVEFGRLQFESEGARLLKELEDKPELDELPF